ncbi:MAG: hypothetical protein U5J63_09390 [Fodinibius sp.]|nr:hypothetical protein [Fodinibius sp.]
MALPPEGGDNRIMGGTQDNGTPFFRYSSANEQQLTNSLDVSTGDGGYAFWGQEYAYVSYQNGNVSRLKIEDDGDLLSAFNGPPYPEWSNVYPANASDQLFIHPYAIDPNDETIMYYPGGTTMWRNTEVDQISNYTRGGTTEGWEHFSAVSSGYVISALTVTDNQPSDRLYYAAYNPDQPPKMFYIDDASTSQNSVDISISGAEAGSYVHSIARNPQDGNEIIAVMSNYNITGLYHSTDGGDSWTPIEGNLTGSAQNPGPSIRSATILPTSAGTIYLVGTSTGVYSTTSVSGSSTSWSRESDDGAPESIGYSVAEYITSRPSDGTIAVGTHGRGIFKGKTNVEGTQPSAFERTITIDNSWRLVGSPMMAESEVTVGSNITMYGYAGRYQAESILKPQKGYWVKSMSGSEVSYDGEAQTDATISLQEGWNIIGGIRDTVPPSAIEDPNGILSSADIFEYADGTYEAASNIKPTKGYWVHASKSGDIMLSTQSSAKTDATEPAIASSIDRLQFSSRGKAQSFLVSAKKVDATVRNRYRMPPQAPKPAIDIRTSNGFSTVPMRLRRS